MSRKYSTILEALIFPKNFPPQTSRSIDVSRWPVPENIQMADPLFYQTGGIDILLGAEFYFDLILNQEIRLSKQVKGWHEHEESTNEPKQQFWKVDEFTQNTTKTTSGRFIVR